MTPNRLRELRRVLTQTVFFDILYDVNDEQ